MKTHYLLTSYLKALRSLSGLKATALEQLRGYRHSFSFRLANPRHARRRYVRALNYRRLAQDARVLARECIVQLIGGKEAE